MKSAAQSAEKFVRNAANASTDYGEGAAQTTKDQSASAIAAKSNYVAGVQASIARGSYEKGLSASGKAGWLRGVQTKGVERFAGGVAAAREKYAQNSGKYDSARDAAKNLPRGTRGSQSNYARSQAVGNALNALRIGK